MQMQRRRATNQELQQGMEEMKQAQDRLEREARDSKELPLEDARGEAQVEEGSKESKLRIEDAPKEKSLPEGVEGKSDRAIQDHPKTTPTAITPVKPGSAVSASARATSGEKHQGTVKTTPVSAEDSQRKDSQRQQLVEQRMGREGSTLMDAQTPHSQPMGSPEVFEPLFTEEQVRQLTMLHNRAPWLYQEGPGTFFPRRPSFLSRRKLG